MPVNLKELRERRDAAAKNLHALMENNPGDKWGADQQKVYDDGMAEIERITAEVKRHEALIAQVAANALEGNTAEYAGQHVKNGGQSEESRAMRAYLTGGISAMAAEDIQRMRGRVTREVQDAMRVTPQNAMSTTTPAEGGYTVATEYYSQLTQALKQFGGILTVATQFTSSTGASMMFPAADATAEEGEIVGQNAPVSLGETQFQNLSMDVYKYSSKKIAVPFELLQDSMFDIEGYINGLLALRIGRITSRHFTVGTGVNQPNGIVTAASVGKVGAAGSNASVGYDDFVDLEHSVDPAYRAGQAVGWMMHDDSLKVVRKIKDAQGRPIFVPGYEQGNPGGAPDRVLNRVVTISQEMPTMAAGAKSILFGDMAKYLVRRVMDLTLFRMADSNFILNGQIGFVAFNRQGGNLIDVGGAVKAYQNGAAAQ
ncbi:phage major capsid protein [Burkholderia glumae]|uniref:Phage major capsid protein n=1 Tax=Burkholderia glumae TaxID=337 RepID=A0ABY5B8K1_BURGL|nr:phage major capsid protein [Burkholderia glumae]USS42761.1 phage major capsid protein [Burkholderia glumae]